MSAASKCGTAARQGAVRAYSAMQRLAVGVMWGGRRRRRESKLSGEEKYQREWKRTTCVYGL